MKRVFTALSLASAFAVGLAAQQSTTTGQDTQQGQRGPRSVTITGCLRAGDTAGTYMLTDVTGLPAMGRRGGGDTSATAGATTTAGAQGAAGTSVMLSPAADVDLAPHVGHKIEVTGTMGGGRGRRGGAGAAAGGTDTGGSGSTASGTAAGGQEQARGRGMMRTVTATSVRMISDSCS